MNWKRASILTVVLCLAVALAPLAFAQDETEVGGGEDEGGFWKDRFGLFIEASTGGSSLDDINTTVRTSATLESVNTLSFDDFDSARLIVGWTLPYDKGRFQVAFEGFRENGFRLNTQAYNNRLANDFADGSNPEVFQWWTLGIDNGTLTVAQTPPTWDVNVDDANGNGIPEADEVQYSSGPSYTATRDTVDALDNNWQTVDFLYGREFGGTRYGGVWSAGLRYFAYEGNLIAPAWVTRDFPTDGAFGFTDGFAFPPLTLTQKTTGFGPTGSMGFVMRFFRERLELMFNGRAAFVLSSLETESGQFLTLVRSENGTSWLTAPGQFGKNLDKDVWHVGVETGLAWEFLPGLSLRASYYVNGYHDAIIVASDITIPELENQTDRGSAALFDTTDLRFDGWRAGLRFQF